MTVRKQQTRARWAVQPDFIMLKRTRPAPAPSDQSTQPARSKIVKKARNTDHGHRERTNQRHSMVYGYAIRANFLIPDLLGRVQFPCFPVASRAGLRLLPGRSSLLGNMVFCAARTRPAEGGWMNLR
jgi:hypothetical protein